jgi:Carboxypeptidase regulatory-like domain
MQRAELPPHLDERVERAAPLERLPHRGLAASTLGTRPMRPSFPLLALLTACSGWLIGPACSRAQQPDTTFELAGEIVNSATGESVAGALVEIYANGRRAQFSGSDGQFLFNDLPRGQFTVMARKPGFFSPQELGAWGGSDPISVPSRTVAIVKLVPESVIYGQVTDESGQPIEAITVRVERWQIADGRKQLDSLGNTRTDDQGNFRIAELRPGTYFVSFKSANGWRNYNTLSAKPEDDRGYGTEFYAGVSDFASATPITLTPGAQVQITQTLTKQRMFQISGVVVGAMLLRGGVNLSLVDTAGDSVQKAVRFERSTGRFQISGIPAGGYVLSAMAQNPFALGRPGVPHQQLRADLPLSVSSDIRGVALALGPGVSIRVHIDDESTEDTSGNVHQVWIRMVSRLSPMFSEGIMAPRFERGQTLPAQIEGLTPGSYAVEASSYGPFYVADLRCGQVDLLRDDLTVGASGSLPPIDVTLRDDGATLTGALTQNGRAAVGGVVIYSQDYPERSQLTRTSNTGSFAFTGLAPGTYQVLAVGNPDALEFRNPAVMQDYLGRSTLVTLGPRDQSTIHLELSPTDVAQP